jgi:hypothetical protein
MPADEIEAIFHPAFWVLAALVLVGVLLYGFGSTIAEGIMGPNEEKVRQECIDRARSDKESCVNGGLGGSMFKTKGRIEKCDEIYRKDLELCG